MYNRSDQTNYNNQANQNSSCQPNCVWMCPVMSYMYMNNNGYVGTNGFTNSNSTMNNAQRNYFPMNENVNNDPMVANCPCRNDNINVTMRKVSVEDIID